MDDLASKSAILGAYGLTIASGVVLNLLFISGVAVWLEKKRSVTRMLIANLALSDILMLLNSFFSPLSSVAEDWIFGDACCKLMPSISAVTTYVSSFSATAIALHRYVSIVEPQWRKLQANSCWLLIMAIWVASAGLSWPIFANTRLTEVNMSNLTLSKCIESWEQKNDGRVYTMASLTLQFVLPSAIIATCYGRVNCVLNERLRFHLSRAYHRSQQRMLAVIRRQRRTTRTLGLMIASYFICWTPLNVFMTAFVFCDTAYEWSFTPCVYVVTHLLATSSAVYNPIIYAWTHDEFRRQARTNFARCCVAQRTVRKRRGDSRQFVMTEAQVPLAQPAEGVVVQHGQYCELQHCQFCADSNDRACLHAAMNLSFNHSYFNT